MLGKVKERGGEVKKKKKIREDEVNGIEEREDWKRRSGVKILRKRG